MDKEEKKIEQMKEKVRARNSYKRFEEILKWLSKRERTNEEILQKIHNTIDGMGGYKYQRTADFASESLLLLMEDMKNGS